MCGRLRAPVSEPSIHGMEMANNGLFREVLRPQVRGVLLPLNLLERYAPLSLFLLQPERAYVEMPYFPYASTL